MSSFGPSTQRTVAAIITASALGSIAYAWVARGGGSRSPSALAKKTAGVFGGGSPVSCSPETAVASKAATVMNGGAATNGATANGSSVNGAATAAAAAAAASASGAGGANHLKPLVVCGPSGVGKGTLISMLREEFPGRFGFSVSHTTRKPRPGEVHGTHYFFSEKPAMQAEVDDNKFIEYANVHGNLYGTSFAAVQSVTAAGKICILDIDVQGVKSVRGAGETVLDPHYLFIAAPSMEALEDRLRGRATETEEALQRRLANAKAEMDYGLEAGNFEKVLVNDDLQKAYAELKETAKAWYPQLAQDEEEQNSNAETPQEA